MSHAFRTPGPLMTAEQFKTWPGDPSGRAYQLVDGELVAMAPPSHTHGRLVMRLGTRLNDHLARHRPGCEASAGAGVQPRLDAAINVRIPDLTVDCGPPTGHFLDQPIFLAEVLSPSNLRETMEAIRACLAIPSLREVLILSATAIAAEVYTRGAGGDWPAEPVRFGPGDALALPGLGFRCAMDELYAGLALG